MLSIYFGAAKNSTEYKSGRVNGMSHIITFFCLLFCVHKMYQSAVGRFRSTLKVWSIIRNKRCYSKEILFTVILWLKSMKCRKPCDKKNGINLSVIWWWIILMFGVYIYNYSETCFQVPVQKVFLPEASEHFSTKIFLLHSITLHYITLWYVFC